MSCNDISRDGERCTMWFSRGGSLGVLSFSILCTWHLLQTTGSLSPANSPPPLRKPPAAFMSYGSMNRSNQNSNRKWFPPLSNLESKHPPVDSCLLFLFSPTEGGGLSSIVHQSADAGGQGAVAQAPTPTSPNPSFFSRFCCCSSSGTKNTTGSSVSFYFWYCWVLVFSPPHLNWTIVFWFPTFISDWFFGRQATIVGCYWTAWHW